MAVFAAEACHAETLLRRAHPAPETESVSRVERPEVPRHALADEGRAQHRASSSTAD
jgi:hypothetical protein